MMACGDTIAALSSGRPPAAIALVRLSGPDAVAIAERVAGSIPPPRQASLRLFRDASAEPIDEGLLLYFPGPHSATGEDIVEFHGHGGRAVVDALLIALVAAGARLAEPGEFTRRALANGRLDLTEAEGLADLLNAETELQRRAAQARASGALRIQVEEWRDRIITQSAAVELAIDYADEGESDSEPQLSPGLISLAQEMRHCLSQPRIEPLRDGVRVVLAGSPNSGKSSLLNVLCGHSRAIVTATAGTTRDSIEVPMAIDGIPLLLVDTAGLRTSDDEVERLGINRSHAEMGRADVILWLGAASPPDDVRILALHAKADVGPNRSDRLAVSAVTGEGLDDLKRQLAARAATLLPAPGQWALTEREAECLAQAADDLEQGAGLADLVLVGDFLRHARQALDRLVGRAGIEEVLDALFVRFCVGK